MPQEFDDLIFNIRDVPSSFTFATGGKAVFGTDFDDLIQNIVAVKLGESRSSGGKAVYGFLRSLGFGDAFPTPPPVVVLNLTADPPVPPVWPVLAAGKFASDVIYGSERMNTNLRFVRGNTYTIKCVAVLDGAVINLINKTLTLSVKKNLNDVANFLQLTSPSGGITIDSAVDGTFTCTFAAALTSSLPAYVQRFPYDIDMIEGSVVNTLARGYLIIVPSV